MPAECEEAFLRIGNGRLQKQIKGRWVYMGARLLYRKNEAGSAWFNEYGNGHDEPEVAYWHPGEMVAIKSRPIGIAIHR